MIPRRTLIAAGPLAVVGCRTVSADYFGRPVAPSRQNLTYIVPADPESLDPARARGPNSILGSLFEGLVHYHPATAEPMAALATHYYVSHDGTRYTFYMRGHPDPQGIALPDSSTLAHEYIARRSKENFSPGKRARSAVAPARWSDGRPIQAQDIIYSWKRILDPAIGSPHAFYLFHIGRAERIYAGAEPSARLAVRAVDDLALEITLRAPTPFFLRLLCQHGLSAVPKHAIETVGSRGGEGWTEPGRIVSNGAFCLKSWRQHDRLVVERNAHYYDSAVVALEQITFLPVVESQVVLNLYRSGGADSMAGERLSAMIRSVLERKKDFHRTPAFSTTYPAFNTGRSPFDNVLVRYAFAMATDKRALGNFVRTTRPSSSLVPAVDGYAAVESLFVDIDGIRCDVLSYNPRAARDLLAKAGGPPGMTCEYLFPALPDCREKAEMIQQQWLENLGVRVTLTRQDVRAWLATVFSHQFKGVAEYGGWGDYLDPNAFLEYFVTGSAQNPSGWTDPLYDRELAEANREKNPVERMRKLAKCEEILLRAMPVIPLFGDDWAYLQNPYVRGITGNLLDVHPFKYAWIDTNWRPA